MIRWNVSAEVFQPAGEKGEVEKNKGGEEVHQMKLYPQSGLMVIHGNGLSNKEQEQEIKGKGETGQDKEQRTVRPEIKETFKNPKGRLAREKKINAGTEDKRRSILSREEGIDFHPQWSPISVFLTCLEVKIGARRVPTGWLSQGNEEEFEHGGEPYFLNSLLR